jgi:hypothetical protein
MSPFRLIRFIAQFVAGKNQAIPIRKRRPEIQRREMPEKVGRKR